MTYINKEEIAKAIRSGKGINIEEILDEFKGMLKEVYQSATEVELTDHLGYEKHTKSDNPNYRNGHNKKTLRSKYGEFDVNIPRDRKAVANDLKAVYTAKTEQDRQIALAEFHDIWGKKYPNITQSWTNNWNELSTFFKYPEPVRKLIYTTNPRESLNSNIKRKTKNKGSFPTMESAFKMLYLSTQQVQYKWNRTKIRNWSEIYPQLCIFFQDIMIKYAK